MAAGAFHQSDWGAMTRIGFVINSLPVGGAEILLLHLAQRMRKGKYQVFVYTLFDGTDLESAFDRLGVVVRRLRLRSLRRFWRVITLSRMLVRDRVDIVHTHLCDADLFGRIAARIGGVRAIVSTQHSLDPWKKSMIAKYRFRSMLDLWTVRWCTVVICVSRAVLEYHANWGISRDKMRVIYPSTPFKPAQVPKGSIRRRLGIALEDVVVTSVGRLHPAKNHIGLIEAIDTLVKDCPKIKVVIVGDGPLRECLSRRADSPGLRGRILFLGNRDDISEIMQMSDVFVLPSLYEGFPITVIEAMQHGLPVIASNVGGLRELLDGRTGILVNPGDRRELADAIRQLYGDRELRARIGRAAQQRALEEFGFEGFVAATEALYEEVLGKC